MGERRRCTSCAATSVETSAPRNAQLLLGDGLDLGDDVGSCGDDRRRLREVDVVRSREIEVEREQAPRGRA